MSKLDDAFLWGFGTGINEEKHRSHLAMDASNNKYMTQLYHRDTKKRDDVIFHYEEKELTTYLYGILLILPSETNARIIDRLTGKDNVTGEPLLRQFHDPLGTRRNIDVDDNTIVGIYIMRDKHIAHPINLFA